jgi:uncharacterized membrane protein
MEKGSIMKADIVKLFVLALVSGQAWAQSPTYSVTDLGVLAGEQMSTAQGLNDQGQAVGTSSNENGEFGVATLFAGGTTVSLGTTGSSDVSIAEGLTSSRP